jgi:Flp pilus assembly protein TadG
MKGAAMFPREARDSGAAAVEFALVLPVLLLVVFAIIDFGRMYWEQVTLTSAAREGVRIAALGESNPTVVRSKTLGAAPGIDAADITVSLDGTTVTSTSPDGTACTPGEQVTVTATTDFSYLTPLPGLAGFIGIDSLTGKGVMRCGG